MAGAVDLVVCNGGDRVHGVRQSHGAEPTNSDARAEPCLPHQQTRLRLISAISGRSSWAIAPDAIMSSPCSFTTGWTIKPPTPIVGRLKRRIWDSWKGTYYKESMPVANSPESQNITDEERMMIQNWVDNGAPRGVAPPPVVAKTKAERIELGRRTFIDLRGLPPAHRTGTAECVSTFGGVGFLKCRQGSGD